MQVGLHLGYQNLNGISDAEKFMTETKLAIEAKAPIRLVETLVEVNDKRKLAMAAKVIRACGGSVAGKRIECSGSLTSRRPTTCATRRA